MCLIIQENARPSKDPNIRRLLVLNDISVEKTSPNIQANNSIICVKSRRGSSVVLYGLEVYLHI